MTTVPVKGAVLEWARKFRGLDEAQAAQRLGISVADLDDYEKERRRPSVSLFEAFAAKYRLPQATLFLMEHPAVPPDPDDFRTIGGAKKRTRSFEFGVALSNIRTWRFQLEKLATDDEDFALPYLPQISLSDDPSGAGERERRRIGVTIKEQLAWVGWKRLEGGALILRRAAYWSFSRNFLCRMGAGSLCMNLRTHRL